MNARVRHQLYTVPPIGSKENIAKKKNLHHFRVYSWAVTCLMRSRSWRSSKVNSRTSHSLQLLPGTFANTQRPCGRSRIVQFHSVLFCQSLRIYMENNETEFIIFIQLCKSLAHFPAHRHAIFVSTVLLYMKCFTICVMLMGSSTQSICFAYQSTEHRYIRMRISITKKKFIFGLMNKNSISLQSRFDHWWVSGDYYVHVTFVCYLHKPHSVIARLAPYNYQSTL